MMCHIFLNSKNVKIRSEHKSAIIPTWDEAYIPRVVLMERATRRPISFLSHGHRLKSLRHQGLGVDHDEWQKQHDERKKAAM
jgi:hypothetical protein